MIPRLVIGLRSCFTSAVRYTASGRSARAPPRVRSRLLTVASLAARSGAAALVAIKPEFLVQDIFHRKARRLVLALEIGLHLLALFVLLDGLNREPDTTLAAVDLHHDRFNFVVHLDQRRGIV